MGIISRADAGVGKAERRAQRAAQRAALRERMRTGTQTREDRLRRGRNAWLFEACCFAFIAALLFWDGAQAWAVWLFGVISLFFLRGGIRLTRLLAAEQSKRPQEALSVGAVRPDEHLTDTTGPAETSPAETSPAETSPAETSPAETSPAETSPAETSPAETSGEETSRPECAGFGVVLATSPKGLPEASRPAMWNPTTATTASSADPARGGGRRLGLVEWFLIAAVVALVAISWFGSRVPHHAAHVAATSASPAAEIVQTVNVVSLQVGDCVRDMSTGDSTGYVDVVPCTAKHLDEVFAIFDLPRQLPGEGTVESLAEHGCQTRFGSYARHSSTAVNTQIVPYLPTQDHWGGDDKSVMCVAKTAETTGSLRG